jgi:hypothetical protein
MPWHTLLKPFVIISKQELVRQRQGFAQWNNHLEMFLRSSLGSCAVVVSSSSRQYWEGHVLVPEQVLWDLRA